VQSELSHVVWSLLYGLFASSACSWLGLAGCLEQRNDRAFVLTQSKADLVERSDSLGWLLALSAASCHRASHCSDAVPG
jgi:hypothetical protein